MKQARPRTLLKWLRLAAAGELLHAPRVRPGPPRRGGDGREGGGDVGPVRAGGVRGGRSGGHREVEGRQRRAPQPAGVGGDGGAGGDGIIAEASRFVKGVRPPSVALPWRFRGAPVADVPGRSPRIL
eukprot:gene6442-biopygen13504